jgi:hypothetical protein
MNAASTSETRRTAMDEFAAASEIAAAMGEGWSVQPGYGRRDAHLAGPDNIRLHVQWGYGNVDRMTISGSLPDELSEHRKYSSGREPEIGVSTSKTPAQIARDIRRRLLPDFAAMTAAAIERRRESDDAYAAQDMLAAELAALLGAGTFRHENRDPGQATGRRALRGEVTIGEYEEPVQGSATVSYRGQRVDFKLTTTPDAARYIAECIRTARAVAMSSAPAPADETVILPGHRFPNRAA